jgi:hypothetical protein
VSPVVVGIRTYSGWLEGKPFDQADKRKYNGHAVIIVNKVNNDVYEVLDSGNRKANDNGIRLLHKSNIKEAWGITQQAISTSEVEENRYGKQKDVIKELQAEQDIWYSLNKMKRKDFMEEYARNQFLYRNAVAYGGYVEKNSLVGIWRPGDITNYIQKKLDHQALPFDLTHSKK